MKIVLLLACYGNSVLKNCVNHITNILKELDVTLEIIDLRTLPYFDGTECMKMQTIKTEIEGAKGVIAVCSVHTIGMHGAMQSFLDHMSLYPEIAEGKPLFVLTRSEWAGEREAANTVLKGWEVLGGMEAGMFCLNAYSEIEDANILLERGIETFYRVIKQERPILPSSERYIYSKVKDILPKKQDQRKILRDETRPSQMKSLVDIIKQDELLNKKENSVIGIKTQERLQGGYIDFSTKEESINDITNLLKEPVNTDELGEFVDYNTSVYKKPVAQSNAGSSNQKKLQNMPHYFIAQHDKTLDMVIQYIVLDTNDKSFITIQEGDCFYTEGIAQAPQVEISLTQDVLIQVLTKQMTYQKAFMLGKLKVRGNFVILPKLDQVFKAI